MNSQTSQISPRSNPYSLQLPLYSPMDKQALPLLIPAALTAARMAAVRAAPWLIRGATGLMSANAVKNIATDNLPA